MVKVTLFNLDFGNLVKLFRKGRIDKVYSKMYEKACELAVFETSKFDSSFKVDFRISEGKDQKRVIESYFDKIAAYQKERIDHHMKEMKELLMLQLKK